MVGMWSTAYTARLQCSQWGSMGFSHGLAVGKRYGTMRVRLCFPAHLLYRRIQFFRILEMWKGALSQITTSQRFPARVAMRNNPFRNARVRVELG